VSQPSPLDEYPLHQAPLSLRYMDTSDRNAYDRCYFNAHDRTGDIFLITGLGVYPNLGVIDAYATVGRGERLLTVRTSDALGDDRSRQTVGAYRIEVLEPLQKIRLVCDADEHGVGFDLTWTGSFPAIEEPRHTIRRAGRVIVDACRFAQVGTWSGVLRVDGDELAVSDDRWVGSRDRSWGIRPIGEPEPPGRASAEIDSSYGFWWTYMPMRFDEFAVVVIAQEDGEGTRTLNEAVRVWPARPGRPPEQLGWPDIEIRYRSGTRTVERAVLRFSPRAGKPFDVEVTSLAFVPLNCGSGYGNDPGWTHGAWRGRAWTERHEAVLSEPAVAGLVPFATVDHVARASCEGAEGWGLFEHASLGAHAPSGFTDFLSVAP
jgi:hypothetical protein